MVYDRLSYREPDCAESFRYVATGMRASHMQHRRRRFVLLDARDQRIGITPCGCRLQTRSHGGGGGCIADSIARYGLGPIGGDISRNPVSRGENQCLDAIEAW